MSVLAHLAASMGERGATQALAYILNQQPGIVQAFVNLLGTAGIRFQPNPRVESERGDDSEHIHGRPDMKIYDAENVAQDGKPRVLVENKFWSGLTDEQPVGYFEMLREDVSSGLLFIMPADRVKQMWEVLKTQCKEARLPPGQGSPEGAPVKWVPVGTKTMLITDWQNVLYTLEGAADGPEIRNDIQQFRRLVEALENLDAFRALRSEDVTNAAGAQRIINYVRLIDSICSGLDAAGIADRGHAASSYEYPSFSRSLMRDSGDGQQVVVSVALLFRVWRRSGGITPLWLQVNQNSCRNFDELERLFEDVDVSKSGNYKYIPIRLKLGVERERVVEDAVEQIRKIFGKFT